MPKDRPGLVLNGEGLCLKIPGHEPAPWHPGFAHLRLKRARDTLVELLALRPGETVLDGTLGMGHDALVLSSAGAQVLALEICAPLAWHTSAGLSAHSEAGRRVAIRRADHIAWLADAADASVDHVYLDPMFPPAVTGTTMNLAGHRIAAHRGPRVPPATLAHAIRVARRTVVMKLAPEEPAPTALGGLGATVEGSKRQHYGVWRPTR
jgi:16S rRNA (guanine1516-N2)-methyltransferase